MSIPVPRCGREIERKALSSRCWSSGENAPGNVAASFLGADMNCNIYRHQGIRSEAGRLDDGLRIDHAQCRLLHCVEIGAKHPFTERWNSFWISNPK